MVFVSNDARDGVAVRFICENPRSHLLEEIGIVDRACCSGINLSEHFFSTKYSRKNLEFLNSEPYYASKKNVNQSSDFPVRRTGSYRHKKALCLSNISVCLSHLQRSSTAAADATRRLIEINPRMGKPACC